MRDNFDIYFILTGGTIDAKTQGQERDALFNHSAIPDYINSLNLPGDFEFKQMVWKDSRDISQEDRTNILKEIEKCGSKNIIITHGTYSMAETARFLKNNMLSKNKTIILTGALVPITFKNSDAQANLRYAIGQLELLPPGVYVSMNGRSFLAEEAAKNEKTGEFYSLLK